MSLSPSIFRCSNCDAQFTKWTGRCLECGKWGTVVKEAAISPSAREGARGSGSKVAPAETTTLEKLSEIHLRRIATGQSELERVLGGGIVPGSVVLVGGEPGIGKSTLALMLAATVPKTIYFSGEESLEQLRLRAERLGLPLSSIAATSETHTERIMASIEKDLPTLAIIDSIQTIASDQAEGEAGSISQVKASAAQLVEVAKRTHVPIILIGQVTKEGTVAGPKTLEHIVDTVLYLEGERHGQYRLLRAVKNRFGPTDEIGVFTLGDKGLVAVPNPSAAFLAERTQHPPGTVVTCLLEGTRPMLVEVQALVSKTPFGYPVRKVNGFDLNRLHMLIAVLQKRAGLHLEQYDVHLNVVGGLEANEPAADLAVAIAVASSFKDKSLGADLAVFGEVDLGGEIRSVRHIEKRLKECERLGLKRVITRLSGSTSTHLEGLKILEVKNIQELITHT